MWKILAKLLPQALFLLGPIITLGWSFLTLLGYKDATVNLNFGLFKMEGAKEEVELKLRLGSAVIGFLIYAANEIHEQLVPKRDYREFRKLYLNYALKKWRKELKGDIRINVMHIYRPWYFLWLVPVFRWTWNDGFVPPQAHFDTKLFLTKWQGVCGSAVRKTDSELVDFRESAGAKLEWKDEWLLLNQFHLWRRQLKKTSNVKCVLSIPLLKEAKGDSPKWKPAGVINLDTLTDEGAEFLKKNKNKLVNMFTDDGKIISHLR